MLQVLHFKTLLPQERGRLLHCCRSLRARCVLQPHILMKPVVFESYSANMPATEYIRTSLADLPAFPSSLADDSSLLSYLPSDPSNHCRCLRPECKTSRRKAQIFLRTGLQVGSYPIEEYHESRVLRGTFGGAVGGGISRSKRRDRCVPPLESG